MNLKKIACLFLVIALSLLTLFGCAPPTQPNQAVEYNLILLTQNYTLDDEESKFLDILFTADGEIADNSLLTFTSNNPQIATINKNGKITGISAGTTTVSASIEDKKVTASVTVVMRSRSLSLDCNYLGLSLGQSSNLVANAYVNYEKDPNPNISWSSSNPNVVSVNSGTVKGLSLGKATITATYNGITDSATIIVGTAFKEATASQINSFSEEYVNLYGRTYLKNNAIYLDHTSNAIEVGIIGSSLTANITTSDTSYMRIWIDGAERNVKLKVEPNKQSYVVASGLSDSYHKIRIVKATEMQYSSWAITSFEADNFATVPEKSNLKIEFIGDSISAGHGALGPAGQAFSIDNSDGTRSYTYYTAQNLGWDYSIVSWSGICAKAYHWGQQINMHTLYQRTSSINTTPYVSTDEPDVIVLNLGTNESYYLNNNSSYGTQFPADYKDMLTLVRSKNPNAYIICLYGMMTQNTTIINGITTAVSQMNDSKIVYNPFTITANTAGSAGHPIYTAQVGWAKQLTDYIKTLPIA